MSGSFISYKGQSFEVRDTDLQIWLHFVLLEIRRETKDSERFQELIDEWSYQSTASRVGTVFPYLDSFASDDQQRHNLIVLCERTLERLRKEETISKEYVSEQGIGGNVDFHMDIRSEWIVSVGEKFIRLLKGELVDLDE